MQVARRKQIDTLVGLVEAFAEEPIWKQADLARRLKVTVETLRGTLDALREAGWPVDRDEDHPHVYWVLPSNFFAGGVLLSREDALEALRLLRRLPSSQQRDRLVDLLVAAAPPSAGFVPAASWHPLTVDPREEETLGKVESSLGSGRAIDVRYFSASRAVFEWRTLSVQRVAPGTPTRVCAWCHRASELRWFRLDNIADLRPSEADRVACDDADVEQFLEASVDGFHDGTTPSEVVFRVREPDARWVEQNLIPPMRAERIDGGIRVRVRASSLLRVARFVVGLGSAAECDTPQLDVLVSELARGALKRIATSTPDDRQA